MAVENSLAGWVQRRPWILETAIALLGLGIGIGLMPVLIFYAGAAALGRYEGASLPALYSSLFAGLKEGSVASWLVFLGPYALYLLFRGLRLWWRGSARWA